jgi:ubiquinone/menaquinone biosynthesis C-methylase UbiE
MTQADDNSTFIIKESGMQFAWLFQQGDMLTRGMGGVFPERDGDLTGINRVLDLASGSGLWAMEVARQYPEVEVIAVDISEPLTGYARAYAKVRGVEENLRFDVMNILKPLDFPDASFDLVNARTLFSSLFPADWLPLLQECKRILKPGGVLRLTELERSMTTSPASERFWDLYVRALQVSGRTFAQSGPFVGIVARLGPLLTQAGFGHIQECSHSPLVAAWAPDFESWRQYSHAITTLLASFIVGTGVCTQEEFSQLQRQMDFEALADDFCEVRYFLTFWGQKPQ